MSEITHLDGLISHVGNGCTDDNACECLLCCDIRDILLEVLKHVKTREEAENPALRALHTCAEDDRVHNHRAMATTTDRLNKHRSRILLLEEDNISTKRHLKVLDRALDAVTRRTPAKTEADIMESAFDRPPPVR